MVRRVIDAPDHGCLPGHLDSRHNHLMPLTQPERDNPLMNRYFREINLPGQQLAKRCGVSHSQIYMARNRNVGFDNAEKISRSVANILRLSERDRLELKAEIMGHPGDLLRARLGGPTRVSRLLDIPEPTAREILDSEKAITHKSGNRALEKLRELGAPSFVIESIDRRLLPSPEPRRSLVTYTESGEDLVRARREAKERLAENKPTTDQALRRSGLQRKELQKLAGVGKETMRKALYKRVGRRSARNIAQALGEAAELTESEIEAVEGELQTAPEKIPENP
jgi:transcriptional regulator with XRE-family HTH domain